MQLNIRDAARMLNLSERALLERIEKEEITSQCVNGRYFLNRDELIEWATVHGFPLQPAGGDEPGDMPTLGAALTAGGIIHGLAGGDKNTVLRRMVESMPLPTDVDPDFLHSVLLAREALGSTGIGDGIAIPHGKLTNLTEIISGFGLSKSGIEFDSLDGKPAHLFFLLIAPDNSVGTHLKMLARISRMLKNSSFRTKLMNATSQKEMYQIIAEEDVKY